LFVFAGKNRTNPLTLEKFEPMKTNINKTEIIYREGQIALVLVESDVAPWERNRVAEMVEYGGTNCWSLVDIRLKKYPQLSTYGCSTCADDYHTSFKPENDLEAKIVKSHLREYREDADGSIHWCTFNGIVRGGHVVDGYRPVRYLDFNQAGYFSRKEGLAKIREMKEFWDAHVGTLDSARIANSNLQVGETELLGLLSIAKKMSSKPSPCL
jgi:hypothetical protein